MMLLNPKHFRYTVCVARGRERTLLNAFLCKNLLAQRGRELVAIGMVDAHTEKVNSSLEELSNGVTCSKAAYILKLFESY